MSNITNLRTARKQKAREEKRATHSENAVKYGITKSERVRVAALEETRRRKLDAHQVEEE